MSTIPEAVTPRDASTTEQVDDRPTIDLDPARPAPDRRAPASAWALLRPLVLRLHFYAGVLVAPFLAVACVTGILFAFSPQLSTLVYDRELLVGPHTGPARPLDDLVAAAAAHPEGTVNSVVVESDPGRTTGVVLRPGPHGLAVRPVQPAGAGGDGARPALHDLLGLPHVVAAPAHSRRLRLTPPVRRGTLRDLAQPASFAIILVAVAVGWALPVLGVSLVLFVISDAAAGAFARRRATRLGSGAAR